MSYKTFPYNQGLTITIRLKDLKNRFLKIFDLKNLKKKYFFLKFWILDGAYAPSAAHMRPPPLRICALRCAYAETTRLYSSRTLGMLTKYCLSIEGSILSWWKGDVGGALDPWSCFYFFYWFIVCFRASWPQNIFLSIFYIFFIFFWKCSRIQGGEHCKQLFFLFRPWCTAFHGIQWQTMKCWKIYLR